MLMQQGHMQEPGMCCTAVAVTLAGVWSAATQLVVGRLPTRLPAAVSTMCGTRLLLRPGIQQRGLPHGSLACCVRRSWVGAEAGGVVVTYRLYYVAACGVGAMGGHSNCCFVALSRPQNRHS